MKMTDRLNEKVLQMYRDGKTKKSIKYKLRISNSRLNEILEEHSQSVRIRALKIYDRAKYRNNVKESICKKLSIKMIDLDEWLKLREFQRKFEHLQQNKKKKPERMRIQDGYSQWISYICEAWMRGQNWKRFDIK
jgi:hypothetical protein